METEEILRQLKGVGTMPAAAIRAAYERRDAVVPALIDAIDRCIADDSEPGDDDILVFAAFHLLASLRATEAYLPLARLLHLPDERMDGLLGDAVTATSHRVMAAVFNGDPAPLYAIIENSDADDAIRSRMCETLAMLAREGTLPHAEAARFLKECFRRLQPQDVNFVWQGWQSAIAMLGLEDLTPLVRQAFARGFIDRTWMRFSDFQDDLAAWRASPETLDERLREEFAPFGDFVEEMSDWPAFSSPGPAFSSPGPADDTTDEPLPDWALAGDGQPAYNPYRNVSRNDLCPCGSGKKFKRCCLK